MRTDACVRTECFGRAWPSHGWPAALYLVRHTHTLSTKHCKLACFLCAAERFGELALLGSALLGRQASCSCSCSCHTSTSRRSAAAKAPLGCQMTGTAKKAARATAAASTLHLTFLQAFAASVASPLIQISSCMLTCCDRSNNKHDHAHAVRSCLHALAHKPMLQHTRECDRVSAQARKTSQGNG